MTPAVLQRLCAALRCPACRADVARQEHAFLCLGCARRYPIRQGVPNFLVSPLDPSPSDEPSALDRLKRRVKAYPKLYSWLIDVCSPSLLIGKDHRALLARLPAEAIVLNLGSGSRRASAQVINVDCEAFPEVDLVADMTQLPFKDGSVDGVISAVTLEHLPQPGRAVAEMGRVVRAGGYAYVAAPFLYGYHAAPNDYHRWTRRGLEAELAAFSAVEVGIRSGPTSALLQVGQEWLAMALSCNIAWLYVVLWVLIVALTSPLKLLDFLFIRYATAGKISSIFYFLGVKPGVPRSTSGPASS